MRGGEVVGDAQRKPAVVIGGLDVFVDNAVCLRRIANSQAAARAINNATSIWVGNGTNRSR